MEIDLSRLSDTLAEVRRGWAVWHLETFSEAATRFLQTLYRCLLTKGFKYDHNKKQSGSRVNKERWLFHSVLLWETWLLN